MCVCGGGYVFFLPPGTMPWRQTGGRGGVVRNTGMRGQREEERDSTCHK